MSCGKVENRFLPNDFIKHLYLESDLGANKLKLVTVKQHTMP